MGGGGGAVGVGPGQDDAEIPIGGQRPIRLPIRQRADPAHDGSLRQRCQRFYRDVAGPAGGVSDIGNMPRALAAVGRPGGVQDTAHLHGGFRVENLADQGSSAGWSGEDSGLVPRVSGRPTADPASGDTIRRASSGRTGGTDPGDGCSGGVKRQRRRQQQLGPVRQPNSVGYAPPGGRLPPGAGHTQRLLPESSVLSRVRRGGSVFPRYARVPPLRPQPLGRLVRDSLGRRLSGSVY